MDRRAIRAGALLAYYEGAARRWTGYAPAVLVSTENRRGGRGMSVLGMPGVLLRAADDSPGTGIPARKIAMEELAARADWIAAHLTDGDFTVHGRVMMDGTWIGGWKLMLARHLHGSYAEKIAEQDADARTRRQNAEAREARRVTDLAVHRNLLLRITALGIDPARWRMGMPDHTAPGRLELPYGMAEELVTLAEAQVNDGSSLAYAASLLRSLAAGDDDAKLLDYAAGVLDSYRREHTS